MPQYLQISFRFSPITASCICFFSVNTFNCSAYRMFLQLIELDFGSSTQTEVATLFLALFWMCPQWTTFLRIRSTNKRCPTLFFFSLMRQISLVTYFILRNYVAFHQTFLCTNTLKKTPGLLPPHQ